MPAGRPTKYQKKYCDEVVAYFDKPLTYIVEIIKRTKDGEYKVAQERVTDLPTFERFAHELGVNHSTLRQWCKDYPDFSKAYDQAKDLQEQLIVANAMAGRYVGPFAQFYLKNKYSYSDRSEIDHTTKGQAMPLLGGTTPMVDDDEEEVQDA
jgi:hypothetical protein